jgi:DNA-binding Xre family transcriptional regulator
MSAIPAWPALRWDIQRVARHRGIQEPWQLGVMAELHERTIRNLWPGDRYRSRPPPKMIEVESLRRLCIALDASPPGVFTWEEEPSLPWIARRQHGPPYLAWRIAKIAPLLGITSAPELGQAAHIFYSVRPTEKPMPANRIWDGLHEVVSLDTLARLLTITRTQPGDLLRWEDHKMNRIGMTDDKAFRPDVRLR